MDKEPKLLPCPFCGGEAFLISDNLPRGGEFHMAGCTPCGIALPNADVKTAQEAVNAWNTRATPPLSEPVLAFARKMDAQSKLDGFREGDDLEYETISDMIDDARFALSKSDTPEELLSRSVSLAVMCLFMADAAGGLESDDKL